MPELERPPRPWSLERQINRRLLAALSLVWLLASSVALWGVRRETGAVLDSALNETAERMLVLPDFSSREGREDVLLSGSFGYAEHIVYQVLDSHGHIRLRSRTAPEQVLDPGAPDGVRNVNGWRVLTLTRADRARKVQVAETVAHRLEVISGSVSWLLGAMLFLVPAASIAVAVVLRHGFGALEPARTRILAAQATGDLVPLSVEGVPQELQPWVTSVNALIDQVRAMIDSERRLAAHATHELRTPIAAARAQAQRLAEAVTDETARQNAQALMRQLDRLARLASRMLQLARIESGVALAREPVDLVVLARLVVDEFHEAPMRERLRLEVHGDPSPILADVDAMGIALRNLIDNALKHAGEKARVTVSVESGAIRVVDNGPGVPAESLEKLVRPFERGITAAEGSGLGLAMVDTITRQCGGTLLLQSPISNGRGFAATLDFRITDEPFFDYAPIFAIWDTQADRREA